MHPDQKGIKLIIGAVDAQTGKYHLLDAAAAAPASWPVLPCQLAGAPPPLRPKDLTLPLSHTMPLAGLQACLRAIVCHSRRTRVSPLSCALLVPLPPTPLAPSNLR